MHGRAPLSYLTICKLVSPVQVLCNMIVWLTSWRPICAGSSTGAAPWRCRAC